MEKAVKIAVLENEVQARILESFLKEQGIPHMIRSYHDSAYDGLFQVSKGWGCVEAPENFKSKILEILMHLEDGASRAPDSV
jgi:hypothetical protein